MGSRAFPVSCLLVVRVACISLAVGLAAAETNIFSYPTNIAEIDFVDSATRGSKDSSSDVVENVSESIRSQLELLQSIEGSDKRSIELLTEYLRLAHVSEENCSLSHADELVFLLHCHQHNPDGYSYRYVKEIAERQFKLCLPKWDQQFVGAIGSIDASDRAKMERLLDQMMQIKFKNEDQPSRPYSGSQLRRLIANPPASAILLFMVSLDPEEKRLPVDENLKNLSFSYFKFKKVYADFVLRLCTNVCKSLESASKVYRAVFDHNLDSSRYNNVNHERDHWMASKMISCSIRKTHDDASDDDDEDVFMKSTYEKLTIQEEIMIENEPGLDELVAFGDTLGEED